MKLFNEIEKKEENPNIQYTEKYPVGMNVKDQETGITYIGASRRWIEKQTDNRNLTN